MALLLDPYGCLLVLMQINDNVTFWLNQIVLFHNGVKRINDNATYWPSQIVVLKILPTYTKSWATLGDLLKWHHLLGSCVVNFLTIQSSNN